MTSSAGQMLGKDNTYSFLASVKSGTATVEINVQVPQQAKNQSTRSSSYTTLRHIPKGL